MSSIKVLQEWTQFWNMSLGLIFSVVMQNFAAIRSAVLEKMTFEVAIFGCFPDIPERKLSLPSWVMEGGCDVARLYVLQSYRSCTFFKRKTRGDTQFWIELAAPFTIANNNEMNSDDRLPFIIFLTPISWDGSNRLWRQRLLPSPCSLWRHKQTLVGVIRPLAGGKCRRFPRSLNDIVFIDISAFTAYFAFGFFVYWFVWLEWPYRAKIVSILIAL